MTSEAVERSPIHWPGLLAVSAGLAALLVTTSGGYGYHRDELYFIALGDRPAFGYVDQPPLVPLLAHALDDIFGGSLVWLRLPSALAAALMVLVTGLIAREFGGRRDAQLLAAASFAVSAIVMAVSHLLSTSTFDLLAWTVVTWLFVRALRDGGRTWILVGLVAGIGLQTKVLVAFLLFALVVGLLAAGPRDVFRSRWPWIAVLVAVVIWTPYLWWQATNGWPQLDLSRAIASGSSGTSEPRWLFVPFQVVLVSPVLVPMWLAGWWRLARHSDLARWRAIAVAYPLLAVVFIATGGKPYYLAGLYPVLLAAGAAPVLSWARRGRHLVRQGLLGVALVTSLGVSSVLFLPILPVDKLTETPIVDINYDAGETVGWSEFAATIAATYDALPAAERPQAIVLAGNYGEAGAMDRFRPDIGPVYSGHNSLWDLGPPPAEATTVIAVGFAERDLRSWFGSVDRVATIDNAAQVDNEERGRAVWICRDPRMDWAQLWPMLRRLG
jgi:hypothetical protein